MQMAFCTPKSLGTCSLSGQPQTELHLDLCSDFVNSHPLFCCTQSTNDHSIFYPQQSKRTCLKLYHCQLCLLAQACGSAVWLTLAARHAPACQCCFIHMTSFLQEQASIPRNKEPEVVRPSKKAEFGSGSGILGALNSAAFVHKPLSSNMQRLGSRMNIPSAIDTSGLVQYVPTAKAPVNKPSPPAAGASLLWLL